MQNRCQAAIGLVRIGPKYFCNIGHKKAEARPLGRAKRDLRIVGTKH